MKTILSTMTILIVFSLVNYNVFSKDIYQSPKLKLDTKKGQTVIIKDENLESNYRIEDNSQRELASTPKDKPQAKRSPSSNKSEGMEYWKVHQRYK